MTSSSAASPRRKAVAALTGFGLVCAAAVTITPANAQNMQQAPQFDTSTAQPAGENDATFPNASDPKFEDGQYIVVMAGSPTASYTGGIDGLAPTKAKPQQRLDVDSPEVKAYESYLSAKQDEVAARVGASITERYATVLNGFTAQLTAQQAQKLHGAKDVMSVVKNESFQLATNTSPDYLGLTGEGGVWDKLGGVEAAGKGVVIGVLDTGIDINHPSIVGKPVTEGSDNPQVGVPYRTTDGKIAMKKSDGSTFKGECQEGEEFSSDLCNDKVVGVRYYKDTFIEYLKKNGVNKGEHERFSVRDAQGHGTHVATTAAGHKDVELIGGGKSVGKASGVAPEAKVAVYKVCWEDDRPHINDGCFFSSAIAAVTDAVKDGVDVISFSITGAQAEPAHPVQIAFMNAAEAGIFVSAAGANTGRYTDVNHPSPWVTTVGASVFRELPISTVITGDGKKFGGASKITEALPETTIVSARSVAAEGADPDMAAMCMENTLAADSLKDKVVLCERGLAARVAKSDEAARVGAVGMVFTNKTGGAATINADNHVIPTVHVRAELGEQLAKYIESAGENAKVAFDPKNLSDEQSPAIPRVANFSSRGPSKAYNQDILKPDLTAPGQDVVAGVPAYLTGGDNSAQWSGTSMATPHVSGMAALFFSQHPNWSPMAVKSALMTTSRRHLNANGSVDNVHFNGGAGFTDPQAMFQPGLVFDSNINDWYSFLKGQGVTSLPLDKKIPEDTRTSSGSNMNLASISIAGLAGRESVTRTVTATKTGLYKATATVPGFDVKVVPPVMFIAAGQTKKVRVDFTPKADAAMGQYSFGNITWKSGSLTTQIPVVAQAVAVDAPEEIMSQRGERSVSFGTHKGLAEDLPLNLAYVTKGKTQDGSVKAGEKATFEFEVPEGTNYTLVDLEALQGSNDLDIRVTRKDNPEESLAQNPDAGTTGAASERIDRIDPKPGVYVIEVDGFSVNGEGKFAIRTFNVNGKNSDAVKVSPETLSGPTRQHQTVTVAVTDNSSDPYLVRINYGNTTSATTVMFK